MSDFFEDREDLREARDWAFCTFKGCQNLQFLLLTKRPEFAVKWIHSNVYEMCETLPNVWVGTTVENQKAADKRIPELLKIPASKIFISCEPLLEAIDLTDIHSESQDSFCIDATTGDEVECLYENRFPRFRPLDWVICGGESGRKARPMLASWAELLRQQCDEAGIPFFMKQGSEKNWQDFKNINEFPKCLQVREFPNE